MPYGMGFAYMIWAQVLFFIVTIGLIFWVIKNTNQKVLNPKEILDRRLVSGEIDKKDYDSLLKTIKGKEA